MKVIDTLYTYDISNWKRKRLLKKMRNKKKVRDLYLIVLPFSGDGLLEVFPYNQLLQPYYRHLGDEIVVVGMAKKKGNAMELVLQMVQEMYDAQGVSFDTQEFFAS